MKTSAPKPFPTTTFATFQCYSEDEKLSLKNTKSLNFVETKRNNRTVGPFTLTALLLQFTLFPEQAISSLIALVVNKCR
jgi:hypothetical protein